MTKENAVDLDQVQKMIRCELKSLSLYELSCLHSSTRDFAKECREEYHQRMVDHGVISPTTREYLEMTDHL